MRGFKAFAFAAAASLLLAGSLQAQQTGLFKWMGVSGAHSRYSTYSTGAGAQDIYRSPYRAQFDMGGGFGPTVDIFCVDFAHGSNTGTYGASFTNLGSDAGSLGTTTRSASLQQYLETAFLANEMVTTTGFTATTASAREDQLRVIQGAMWEILYGAPIYYQAQSGSWLHSAIATWRTRAVTGAAGMNPYEWTVVDQRTQNQQGQWVVGASQEYLTRVQVTPEPATLLLLGTGLLATLMAAGALRRSAV